MSNTPTTLYIIRHGVTEWNKKGIIQGHTDIELSPEGREEAFQVAKSLKDIPFSAVISSDLKRAYQTAEIIAHEFHLKVEMMPQLRERHWGAWQGLNIDQLRETFGGIIERYIENPQQEEPVDLPGIARVETYRQAMRRVIPCLQEIASRYTGETVLIVAHGGILRGLMLHLEHPEFIRPQRKNGSYLVLEAEGETFRIQGAG